jgi:site-specific DNA-methyltransferase (adenine-specific)
MKYKIYNEDAVEWAKNYQKGKFHALLCDAPYHLTSIVKRFGKKNSASAKEGTDGVFRRASSKGFMGQTWDGGDIAFQPETWEALGEHLYPGAFGMCFSASRNWHRLAVAIEDAGFIIHPTIFGWLQGQGFPKATNISKQLHKQGKEDGMWEGHRYGLQALKPAVEPIIVFQKPYEGKPLDNIIETGAGAINIDGGRIPLNGDSYVINTFDDGAKPWGDAKGEKFTSRKIANRTSDKFSGTAYNNGEKGHFRDGDTFADADPTGRWPANFILDESVAGRLGDTSRFFFNVQKQIDEADPIYYCGKVSPKERNAGLDDLDEKDLGHSKYDKCANCGGYIFQSENRDSKCVCDNPERVSNKQRNPHPTLKPIALAKYLATLLLPPEEYAPRRIFIPFSGVASEMIGAMQAGWEHIVGVEFDTENDYVDIAHKRMEYWSSK